MGEVGKREPDGRNEIIHIHTPAGLCTGVSRMCANAKSHFTFLFVPVSTIEASVLPLDLIN